MSDIPTTSDSDSTLTMPDTAMTSDSDFSPPYSSEDYMADASLGSESDSSEDPSPIRKDSTFYYLLSHLPDKSIADLDATRGWRSAPYGNTYHREHLICTFKALNFDYASVVYIVWLAWGNENHELSSVHQQLALMSRRALNAKWFRNAVRFYSLHVVDSYGEAVATTIDTPGLCAFRSIERSLPDFGMLHKCLFTKDWYRTPRKSLTDPNSLYIHFDSSFSDRQERNFFDMPYLLSDSSSDWEQPGRLATTFVEDSSRCVLLLQKDCSTLEPQSRKGYSRKEFKAYLKSFDGDDHLIFPATDLKLYTRAIHDGSAEDDKMAASELFTELRRKWPRRRRRSSR